MSDAEHTRLLVEARSGDPDALAVIVREALRRRDVAPFVEVFTSPLLLPLCDVCLNGAGGSLWRGRADQLPPRSAWPLGVVEVCVRLPGDRPAPWVRYSRWQPLGASADELGDDVGAVWRAILAALHLDGDNVCGPRWAALLAALVEVEAVTAQAVIEARGAATARALSARRRGRLAAAVQRAEQCLSRVRRDHAPLPEHAAEVIDAAALTLAAVDGVVRVSVGARLAQVETARAGEHALRRLVARARS